MTDERCDGCRFWKRTDRGGLYDYENHFCSDELSEEEPAFVMVGQCQRHPPTIMEVEAVRTVETIRSNHKIELPVTSTAALSSASRWPVTWEFEWCGEWQALPPTPPAAAPPASGPAARPPT